MKKFKSILCLSIIALLICNLGYANPAWLVKTKISKVSFTLLEDGTIERTNRGDPKTDYDQKENCAHGKSKNCQESKQIEILDITNWTLSGAGGIHEAYQVYYISPELGWNDQIWAYYNIIEGTVVAVVRETRTTLTEMPDLSSWNISETYGGDSPRFIFPDGTGREVYHRPNDTLNIDGYLEEPSHRDGMTVDYDALGNFVKAQFNALETLSLDSVKIPPYYTELYGWTEGI